MFLTRCRCDSLILVLFFLCLLNVDSIPDFNLLHPRSPCCSCLERSCVCNSPDKILILLFVVCFDPIVTSFTFSLLLFVTIFDLKTCASDRTWGFQGTKHQLFYRSFKPFQASFLQDVTFARFFALTSAHVMNSVFLSFTYHLFLSFFISLTFSHFFSLLSKCLDRFLFS